MDAEKYYLVALKNGEKIKCKTIASTAREFTPLREVRGVANVFQVLPKGGMGEKTFEFFEIANISHSDIGDITERWKKYGEMTA